MSKHRLGWADLLLVGSLALALTGFFYSAMAMAALYAVLYHRATHRHDRRRTVQRGGESWQVLDEGPGHMVLRHHGDHGLPADLLRTGRLTREDIARIYDVPEDIIKDRPRP